MCLELETLFGVRISCIAVIPAEIKTTVCLGLYIHKVKVCACTSFLQETKASIHGVQLPEHTYLMPI